MVYIQYSILLLFIFCFGDIHSQINSQDSSVQVISYWNVGDRYEYSATLQKLKYTDIDTSSNETMTYDIEVTVLDSTANSYTVRWFYKNFKTDSTNPLIQKVASLADDISVDIKMNELGTIDSIENWKEVKDYIYSAADALNSDIEILPGLGPVIAQMKTMYSTKESIEAIAIQDVQQLQTFHGAKYMLNDTVSGHMYTSNLYDNSNPFNTYVAVVLEDLDTLHNEYTLRSFQEVDSEQLTESTFSYLKATAEKLGHKFTLPEAEFILKNMTETVSRIHDTGWVLESVLWKEVYADGVTNMEIRTILLN